MREREIGECYWGLEVLNMVNLVYSCAKSRKA